MNKQLENCIEIIKSDNTNITLLKKENYFLVCEPNYPNNYYSIYYYTGTNTAELDDTFRDLKEAVQMFSQLNVVSMRFEKLTRESILAHWEMTGCQGYVHLENIGKWAYTKHDGILADENTLDDWIYQQKSEGNMNVEDYEDALEQIRKLNDENFDDFIVKNEEQSFNLENVFIDQTVKVAHYYYSA